MKIKAAPRLLLKMGICTFLNRNPTLRLLFSYLPLSRRRPLANPEVIVMDGTALVNMIKSSVQDKTFAEYASNTFAQYSSAQLQHVKCIDIVWDEYVEASWKTTTQHKHGQGVRKRVAPGNKLPRKWMEFLRNGATSKNYSGSLLSVPRLSTPVRSR